MHINLSSSNRNGAWALLFWCWCVYVLHENEAEFAEGVGDMHLFTYK